MFRTFDDSELGPARISENHGLVVFLGIADKGVKLKASWAKSSYLLKYRSKTLT